jgi:hypothetical protein
LQANIEAGIDFHTGDPTFQSAKPIGLWLGKSE